MSEYKITIDLVNLAITLASILVGVMLIWGGKSLYKMSKKLSEYKQRVVELEIINKIPINKRAK